MKAAIVSEGSISSKWTHEAMKKYFDEVDDLRIKKVEVVIDKLKFSARGMEILKSGWMNVYPVKMED